MFVNFDFKNLSNWLNANKMSMNLSKTELVMFKQRINKLDFYLKLKLNYERYLSIKSANHICNKIYEILTWNGHINDIAIKPSGANSMLYKLREFARARVIKSIYHAIFDCYLNYAKTGLGRNKNS